MPSVVPAYPERVESVKFTKLNVPTVGATLSTVTAMVFVVVVLPAASVTVARNS